MYVVLTKDARPSPPTARRSGRGWGRRRPARSSSLGLHFFVFGVVNEGRDVCVCVFSVFTKFNIK